MRVGFGVVVAVAVGCLGALCTAVTHTDPDTRLAVQFKKTGEFARCLDCLDLGDHKKSKSFTLELWLRTDMWPKEMAWALMHAGPCSPNQCMFFGFRQDGAVIFGFIMNDLVVSSKDFRADVGEWVHWAATYNANTLARTVHRNGVVVGTDVASEKYSPDSSDLHFGSDNMQNNRYTGTIDEARFWVNAVIDPHTLAEFACVAQADRALPAGHPFAAALAARFVFRMVGRHVPNTVNLHGARVFGADTGNIVEGFTGADEERFCLVGDDDEASVAEER